MIRFVVSGAFPRLSVMRSRCLADPDSLLTIAGCLEAANVPNAPRSDRFSLILHDLRMGGAWKRTNRGRLQQTEEMLCDYIHAEPGRGLTLLDIGASDGITTVEAVRALRRAFGDQVQAIVADRNLWLLRYRRGPVVEYRAADGEPIMARLGRLGIRLARPRQGAPSDANPLARLYLRCAGFRSAMRHEAQIPLVHPAARREPGVAVMELDCLVSKECLKDRIAAIRASNVLNLGYFGLPQIRLAVGHLHGYLRDGGCLVVSRNHDQPDGERENGSVWLKDGARFRWVRDFGAGSEIRQIVDDWPFG
ncbi:MAG: hypothetical protein WB710_01090 [Stellaceae bacterium]